MPRRRVAWVWLSAMGALLAGAVASGAESVEFPPHLRHWDVASAPARRIALVIGNADYERVNKLPGAIEDANAVDKVLCALGFKVTKALDVPSREKFLSDVFLPFVETIEQGDFVVFYFSGHGFSFKGNTYLAPTTFPPTVPGSKVFSTFIAEDALRGLIDDRNPAFALVITDACRTIGGPVLADGDTVSGGVEKRVELRFEAAGPKMMDGGSTDLPLEFGPSQPVRIPDNALVFFASALGEPAIGSSDNELSHFTAAMIKHLGDPDQELSITAKLIKGLVRRHTKKLTGREQRPWTSDPSLTMVWMNPTEATRAMQRELWLNALRDPDNAEAVAAFRDLCALCPHSAAANRWLEENARQAQPGTLRSAIAAFVPEGAWRRAAALEPLQARITSAGVYGSFAPTRGTRSLSRSAARASADPTVGLPTIDLDLLVARTVSLGSEPPPEPSALVSAQILAAHGVALALTEVELRATPSMDGDVIGVVGYMQPVTVTGYREGGDGRIWNIVLSDDTDQPGYVLMPERPVRDTIVPFGMPLAELYLASEYDDTSALVDPESVVSKVARLNAEGRRIQWVSIATAATKSRRASALLRSRASHASRILTEQGVLIGQISIETDADFEGSRIRLRFFGE